MSKLLVIESSPRGVASVSRTMTQRFVTSWRAAHPSADANQAANAQIIRRDLTDTPLRFVDAAWLQAYFTPPAQQSAQMQEALRLSDQLVAEVLAADHIVIATPVYNYNVPAILKAWVDHIVRKGVTLGVDGRGLLTGKRATLLIASGGVYTEGSPIRERDIATSYLRLILGVLGITDVSVVAGGGAKAVDLGEQTMAGFVDKLGAQLDQAAGL